MPVIDFLKEHIPDFNPNNFRGFRKQVEKALKGLKVTVTYRTTNQKFKISGLTDENTLDISFDIENKSDQIPPRKVSLVSYFREKYSKEIMHSNIPCLDLGKSNRKIYVPMEFCIIAGGQRCPKELLDRNQSEKLRQISLASPNVRESTIYNMVQDRDGPCSKRLGILMEQPLFYKRLRMNLLYDADNLYQQLERCNNESYKIGGEPLQILVCVMPQEAPGYAYANLKWICETKVGILTQCCLTKNCNRAKDQFLANVALKINAKLGEQCGAHQAAPVLAK
ncbi:hypothetical protein GH714_005527 [Hevea brasiliensis]|uniref:PAZ domain-containing protein n=1 Tax=Hevea brasiliensis TaxID=3981 RepID=A0A6A6L0Q8_HEVBR|nr:hypothetical protein GH714_005527 [Hevea brasiliensis]